jgi:hypothetical protein
MMNMAWERKGLGDLIKKNAYLVDEINHQYPSAFVAK